MHVSSRRVASRFLLASFSAGDYIFYGRWKNKKAIVVRIFEDARGIPYVEIQPLPKGRKLNRTFSLYTIRKMSPEAVAEAQALEAAANV
jgi:hypothetical protein